MTIWTRRPHSGQVSQAAEFDEIAWAASSAMNHRRAARLAAEQREKEESNG